jgi:hypothetical protein
MTNEISKDAALWLCHNCNAWWCSQSVRQPTRFMIDLPIATLEGFGWENFRGWRLGGKPHVATCPDCRTIAKAPVFGETVDAPPLKMSLSAIIFPASSPAA